MPHEFELRKEITLDATPSRSGRRSPPDPESTAGSWAATRSSPARGRSSMTIGGQTEEGVVTAWDPPRALRLPRWQPDGSQWMAFEWLIEGRDDGTCVLRLVQSGVLGDDWETEYDALGKGWDMCLHQLAQYLGHFRGRPVAPVLAMQPGRPADPRLVGAVRRARARPPPRPRATRCASPPKG